ncbi:MAG TPA: nucleotidyltransferase family protein [Acidimicrobiales bacterium]|nr:nucleotidyltransferase family protein [Acidimicrobiales bacterium]
MSTARVGASRGYNHVPDRHQRLLVRAAVGGDDAADAWREWCVVTENRPRSLDEGSIRLLPLVHWVLTRHDGSLPRASHLAVLHRQTWLRNHRMFRGARQAIRTLQADGHDVMLIKGAALILRYYGDVGARTLGDVDLVTRDSLGVRALASLEAVGWRHFKPSRSASYVMQQSHGVGLIDGRDGKVDLHRRVPHLKLADDRPMWERSIPVMIDDLQTLTLATPDELLLTLGQGWRWNRLPSLRWIPDAMVLAERMTTDDWRVFLSEVQARHLVVKTTNALRYLSQEFGLDVPGVVMSELRCLPVERYEHAEERAELRPWPLLPPWSAPYFEYARAHPLERRTRWWFGFAVALQRRLSPPPGTAWPQHLAQRTRRRATDAIKAVRSRVGRWPS